LLFHTYLNGPVTLAHDLEANALSSVIQFDTGMLGRNDRSGHFLRQEIVGIGFRESVAVRHGQETAIQRALQISFITTNGVVDGDEVCTGGESTLDL
jgi:hypothetical protein